MSHSRFRGVAAALPALLAGLPGGAQEAAREDWTLEALKKLMETPIEVASTRAETIFTTPSSVSIITREAIAQYGIQTVAELLDRIPGVSMYRTHFKQYITTSRGILQEQYATKVLLLINGVPTWNGSTGEGEPYRVDVADIERVEVLRGSASVLYGSKAYVGAVNLVLRRPDAREGEVRGGGASRGGYQGGLRYFDQPGKAQVLVAANARNVEGRTIPFKGEDGSTQGFTDYLRLKTATAQGVWGAHTLLFNAFAADEGFIGNDPSWLAGINQNHHVAGRLFSYGFQESFGESTHLKAGLSFDWNARDFARRQDNTRRSQVEGYREAATLKVNTQITKAFGLEAGADFDKRVSVEYTDTSQITGATLWDFNMRDRSVSEKSFFIQGRYDQGDFTLVAGSRYTDNQLAGSNVSSRLTAVYSLGSHNSFKLIGGQSFRAPTLFELYFLTNSFTVFGNPELKPEKATSIELAHTIGFGAFGEYFLQTLLYHARYEDKIARVRRYPLVVSDPADRSVMYRNTDPFTATGLELEFHYQNGTVDLFFNADSLLKTDSGDEVLTPAPTGHYNFKYVPKTNLSAGFSLTQGNWVGSLAGNYASAAEGPLASIGGQGTMDASLSYRHPLRKLRVLHTAYAKNLGDRVTRIAEYTRRNVNDVPLDGMGRQIGYAVKVEF